MSSRRAAVSALLGALTLLLAVLDAFLFFLVT